MAARRNFDLELRFDRCVGFAEQANITQVGKLLIQIRHLLRIAKFESNLAVLEPKNATEGSQTFEEPLNIRFQHWTPRAAPLGVLSIA